MAVTLTRKIPKFRASDKNDFENERRICIVLMLMINVYSKEAGENVDVDNAMQDIFGISKSTVDRVVHKGPKQKSNDNAIYPIDKVYSSGAQFMFGLNEKEWRRYINLWKHRKASAAANKEDLEGKFRIDLEIDNKEIGTVRKKLLMNIKNWRNFYNNKCPEYRVIQIIRNYYSLTLVENTCRCLKQINDKNIEKLSVEQKLQLKNEIKRINKIIDASENKSSH